MGRSACRAFVQKRILAVINTEAYHVQLPVMSEEAWDSISDDSDDSASENRRMEWLGDAMLAGRISLKAYEMVSDGNVEFYSIVRHCVVSNLTLTHLMQKIAADAATTCPTNKTAADVFEAMAGALYKEHYENGSQHEFNAWVDDTFMPLIETAKAAFRDDNRSDTSFLHWRGANNV
ncbi:hypothetical protein K438DRAFT_1047592 [Mycena galopus ATCC 62051]|nr:hypothetical protein K438DRAFT_1047592 [Mycena galopus ATCC 62051]